MVNPRQMCRKHLLGEHVEHHMFVGSLNKKLSMSGYIENNLLEPLALVARHDSLVEEMTRRGYNHQSPLPEFDLTYLNPEEREYRIDREEAAADLFNRCPDCRARRKVYV